MLVVSCDTCGRRQLLPLSRVLTLTTDSDHDTNRLVHQITYRCWCEHLGRQRILGPAIAGSDAPVAVAAPVTIGHRQPEAGEPTERQAPNTEAQSALPAGDVIAELCWPQSRAVGCNGTLRSWDDLHVSRRHPCCWTNERGVVRGICSHLVRYLRPERSLKLWSVRSGSRTPGPCLGVHVDRAVVQDGVDHDREEAGGRQLVRD
jgi:hypothetical protein